MNKFKIVTYLLCFSFLIFSLVSGCGNQTTEPIAKKTVAPPQNLKLVLKATPLDSTTSPSTSAVVSWDASSAESNADFRGYRVITIELNNLNQFVSVLQEQAITKPVHNHTIDNIDVMTKYKTYVVAELTDGTRSDSLETPIYSGIFYNTNGSIDSYTSSGNSQSGYGWNVSTGEGTQCSYNQANSKKIDLHLREESTGELFFKSPDFLDGLVKNYKYTRMVLIGFGKETFDATIIDRPDSLFRTEAQVITDGVYLLETQEGYYIKIWVQNYGKAGDLSYYNVKFYYKVQPVAGLRILKR